MDITEYFNLKEEPFRTSPSPRFLYYSDQVQEAIARCEFMARDRVGPIYMYGPIGSGKSTMLKQTRDKLGEEEQFIVSYISDPVYKTPNAFLRNIMESFSISPARAYDQSLNKFGEFLIDENTNGKIPVLLVDEAQKLNKSCLDLIHSLLNFETELAKLLQIVLVGQEELSIHILKIRPLASRMFPISINTMSPEELQEMIKYRWMVAGGKDTNIPFEGAETFDILYAYSKGLPRDTIKICDELLRHLYATDEKKADKVLVEEVSKRLNYTA